MSESILLVNCIITIYARINNSFGEHKLSHVLALEGLCKAGSGNGVAALAITALHPTLFEAAVWDRIGYKRAKQVIAIMDCLEAR